MTDAERARGAGWTRPGTGIYRDSNGVADVSPCLTAQVVLAGRGWHDSRKAAALAVYRTPDEAYDMLGEHMMRAGQHGGAPIVRPARGGRLRGRPGTGTPR